MADPISGALVQQVAEQNVAKEPEARKPADSDHQSRFESAMNRTEGTPDAGQVNGSNPVDGTLQVQDANAVAKPEGGSIGDAILDGFDRLKVSHDSRMQNVATMLQEAQDAPMSVGSAMKLQFELMQMSLEQDLTTKVADKSSQGVQTLFKNN